jgi:hypothetical protein
MFFALSARSSSPKEAFFPPTKGTSAVLSVSNQCTYVVSFGMTCPWILWLPLCLHSVQMPYQLPHKSPLREEDSVRPLPPDRDFWSPRNVADRSRSPGASPIDDKNARGRAPVRNPLRREWSGQAAAELKRAAARAPLQPIRGSAV